MSSDGKKERRHLDLALDKKFKKKTSFSSE